MARRHSDQEIKHALSVLEANRGNQSQTASQLGIDRTLLNKWARRAEVDNGIQEAEPLTLADLDDDTRETIKQLKTLKKKAIKRAIDNIDKASPAQAAVIMAIATDKENLLSGKPTSRNESVKVRYVQPESLREAASKVVILKRGEYRVGKVVSSPEEGAAEFDVRGTKQVIPYPGQETRPSSRNVN